VGVDLWGAQWEKASVASTLHLPLGEELPRLRQAWPSRGWTWDQRSNCVASSFSADTKDENESVILQSFPVSWNYRSIQRAPEPLRQAVARTGGVRSDQLVFSLSENRAVFPYVLWWPWGDDTTISVRVALSSESSSSLAALRELFGANLD
jgi:hypothetical protein